MPTSRCLGFAYGSEEFHLFFDGGFDGFGAGGQQLAGVKAFALLGFAVGTGYQYGLLYLMVNLIFKDVGEIPNYSFNVGAMFITLAAFIMCYAAITAFYVAKINKVSVKEIMLEN